MTGARRVERARRNRAPGRVVRIPLGDGRSGYARQLLGPRVEVYEHVGPDDEQPDLLDLVDGPVAFSVWVMDRALKRGGRWTLLDVVPLDEEEQARVHRSFKQDPISGRLSIYTDGGGDEAEVPATREECEGLERAAAWDPEHVEDRLRDHVAGRPNRWLESLRLRPGS